jgi:serine/threonine-protein kinase
MEALEQLGGYRIDERVGQGSMATVYLAHREASRGRVALKVLDAHLTRETELRTRFEREFEAARRLDHPNVVRVLDAGHDGKRLFIALEFVEGTDLDRVISDPAKLSLEWKLDLLRQLIDGLSHAHELDVVHRDVKPANLRITPEGVLKIMDFGMARLRFSTLTRRGQLLGSAHYIAPEQLEGGTADARADMFSVGLIAYELLSARRPFEADSLPAYMAKVTRGTVDPAPLPKSAYSPDLESLVLKALERRPEDRFADLGEMRLMLKRLVAGSLAR